MNKNKTTLFGVSRNLLLSMMLAVGASAQVPRGVTDDTQAQDRYYLRAVELRNSGKNLEALAAINQAIWFDSNCGKCFGLKSGIEGNLQMFADGVADGHHGMIKSKTPRDKAIAAYNKGFNLGGLGRNSEALEAYNLSIEFDPTYAMAHFGKGKVYYFLEGWADSKKALEEALRLNPNHGASWAYLAEAQIGLRDLKAGAISANRAVELAPSDARSFRARTISNYWDGNYAAMLADATRVLELDATRHHAHLLRGHSLKLLGRESEAAVEYALEPDRKAVEAGMHPSKQVDMRIYNCGDFSTEIQTSANLNGDSFTDCAKRVNQALDEYFESLQAPTKPKPSVPSLPSKR